MGLFTFVTPTRTFVNNVSEIAGFSRAGAGGLDLYNGPENAGLGTWDMLSSFGPVIGDTNLLQWQSIPLILTDGGQLIFDSGATTGTFEAVVGAAAVPEPTTMTLAVISGLVMATGHAIKRRRRE